VAQFFDGENMKDKFEALIAEHYSEDFMLSFVGPYAPPVPPLDLAHMKGAVTNILASFPDLTFNPEKVKPKFTKDGGWAADIVVVGTHTGAAFTPMPDMLPAIDTTKKKVVIGPETFTLYTDASGKVIKTTVEPLKEGAPAGPPGFYVEIGGVMPTSPPPTDMLMACKFNDFNDWFAGFKQHANSKTFAIGGKTFTVPVTRSEVCDEDKTDVFVDIKDSNAAVLSFFSVDMPKFGSFVELPEFEEMSKLAYSEESPPPELLLDPPSESSAPSTDAPAGNPNIFVTVEVASADKWIEGFLAHGTSKTGTWGFEVPLTRAEVCDESKTRVFKSALNPNRVAVQIFNADMAKMGNMFADPKFTELVATLGEVEGTKTMKILAPMPPAASAPA